MNVTEAAIDLYTQYRPQLEQLASHLPELDFNSAVLKSGVGGAGAAALLAILTKSEFAGHALAPGLALVGAQALQADKLNAVFCACAVSIAPPIAKEVVIKVLVRSVVSIPWAAYSILTIPYVIYTSCRESAKDAKIKNLETDVKGLKEELRTARQELATANQANERLQGELAKATQAKDEPEGGQKKKRKADPNSKIA